MITEETTIQMSIKLMEAQSIFIVALEAKVRELNRQVIDLIELVNEKTLYAEKLDEENFSLRKIIRSM